MGLSKIAKECEECKFKDECNNKKMVGYMTCSEPNSSVNTPPLSQPMGIKHTSVKINLGNDDYIETSLEEIKKNMKKEFYKNAGLSIF